MTYTKKYSKRKKKTNHAKDLVYKHLKNTFIGTREKEF